MVKNKNFIFYCIFTEYCRIVHCSYTIIGPKYIDITDSETLKCIILYFFKKIFKIKN